MDGLGGVVKKRGIAALASIALAGGVALVTQGGAARAGVFDPCSAVNQGRLRYSPGTAAHLVFAVSPAYSSNYVVVTECGKTGGAWRAMTATTGRAGTGGFAEPGQKREGDGKSPTGSYTLSSAFGVGDPGTGLPYRRLAATGDCWGATPGQSSYNEYYAGGCRSTDEDLSATMRRGPYEQAVVIDYNRPNAVPGYGSAIFVHVGGVTPTAGCVSIAEDRLRAIMRTLVPGDRMIMGPQAALFRA
jgi:L,D-peptidoglycan transpeptidase YkuD (ErfK/YbiS/YcfS/YnhG family)